ncbi:hypothetical protein GQ600_6023 [Phytophthora cactorum]|nr:hypothetical protein GQ600_6023 [Phytophthora cactorum]
MEAFPLNSAAVESLLKGDNAEEICHAVEAYAHSIVSTSYRFIYDDTHTRIEMARRDTTQCATRIIEERGITVASIASESDLKAENGLSHDERKAVHHQLNSLQMCYCKSDDEPFQNDYVMRLIEMLPPSLSDN